MIHAVSQKHDERYLTERYVLLQEIGRGGMGEVHRVRDESLERESALKLLHRELREDEENLERFVDEAKITGQLDHPNIVPVYELGDAEGGGVFFSMKLVEGETLERILEKDGPLRLEPQRLAELLRIFVKACEAVAFAHSRGVVHRDLKPSNVMVGDFGQVYVMDWGVARRLDGAHDAPLRATEDSEGAISSAGLKLGASNVVGSAAYMAPEQARGRQDLVDERSDVFLLGATLYHILTGQAPYEEVTLIMQLIRALDSDYVPAEKVVGADRLPAPLLRIVERAMAHDHKERYPTVSELQKDVELFLHGFWHQSTEYYPAGSKIVVEGEPGNTAFILVEGRCRVTAQTPRGPQVLRELKPGEVFGEMAIFSSAPRTATVEAIDRVTVKVVTRETVTAGLGLNSWLGVFIKTLADRFSDADRRLRELEE